ncbi:MAG: hypothetical protein ACFFCS_09975, partial [Candidatus Hodarchaeota archaeon]
RRIIYNLQGLELHPDILIPPLLVFPTPDGTKLLVNRSPETEISIWDVEKGIKTCSIDPGDWDVWRMAKDGMHVLLIKRRRILPDHVEEALKDGSFNFFSPESEDFFESNAWNLENGEKTTKSNIKWEENLPEMHEYAPDIGGHRDTIQSLGFSNDEKFLVSSSRKKIIEWNIESGKLVKSYRDEFSNEKPLMNYNNTSAIHCKRIQLEETSYKSDFWNQSLLFWDREHLGFISKVKLFEEQKGERITTVDITKDFKWLLYQHVLNKYSYSLKMLDLHEKSKKSLMMDSLISLDFIANSSKLGMHLSRTGLITIFDFKNNEEKLLGYLKGK